MANNEENRTKTTFVSNIADVSLSHLLELMIALGSYREGLVLVGGWVPYLLLKEYQNKDVGFQHVGSKDIDIAVNPEIVDEKRYATILELLKGRGYRLKEGSTYSFIKDVTTNKGSEQIQIDFLGPEYGGTASGKRHQRVQDDFLVRKARGADEMFNHAITITLAGKLPNGAEGKTTLKIADIVGIITMKGIVVGSRYKEKDAYDINSLVLYYKSGPLSVAEEIRPHMGHGLVREALEVIHDKFRSREAEGPNWVADFQEAAGEVREQVKTQSYLQMQRFLAALYEPPKPPKDQDKQMPDNIPVLDIEPSSGGSGGSAGHFVYFQAINTGEKVAIDCQWGIRGFAYEWRSPDMFVLKPGDTRKLEYRFDGEKPYQQLVPELNIFFEYKDNRGVDYFTRRELVQEKTASYYDIAKSKVGKFHRAVILQDTKIRSIEDLPKTGDREEVAVKVAINGQIKYIHIGISGSLLAIFSFSTKEEVKAALAELTMRKVRNMLREGKLQDHLFTSEELPQNPLSGFEAYQALRDSLDR